MGKGVPAGLIMTMTRGMLRAEVLNGHPPRLILEHLNSLMYEDLEHAHRFVTMFYAEYDTRDKLLSYSNAAHVPPLLWRSHTNTVQALDTLGALVGFEPHSRYEQRSCSLQKGDVLLLYTDGITEAPNARGSDLTKRICAVLCAGRASTTALLKKFWSTSLGRCDSSWVRLPSLRMT